MTHSLPEGEGPTTTPEDVAATIVNELLETVEFLTVVEALDEVGLDSEDRAITDRVYAEIRDIRKAIFE